MIDSLRQLIEAKEAGILAALFDTDCCLLEVGFGGILDLTELVGISIGDWKPIALNLNQDSMPLLEGVHRLVELKRNFSDLTGSDWLRILEAISELASKDVGPNHHLESSKFLGGVGC